MEPTFREDSVHDGINVPNDTYYPGAAGNYFCDGGLFHHLSLTGRLIDGAGETTMLTVEATNDEDNINANWIQLYGYDSVNHVWVNEVHATNQTTDFGWDFDYFHYRFVRFRIQATAPTNTVIIKSKRLY